jgi:hypothetical protein
LVFSSFFRCWTASSILEDAFSNRIGLEQRHRIRRSSHLRTEIGRKWLEMTCTLFGFRTKQRLFVARTATNVRGKSMIDLQCFCEFFPIRCFVD